MDDPWINGGSEWTGVDQSEHAVDEIVDERLVPALAAALIETGAG